MLTEQVEIWSFDPRRKIALGRLVIGADGLPEVEVPLIEGHMGIHAGPLRFRPATIPAAWIVTSPTCGTLYSAWDLVWNLIEEIARAQREAEDDAKERERNRSIDNRIEEELDHDRA